VRTERKTDMTKIIVDFFLILRTCLKNEFLLITYLWLSRNSKNKQVSVVGPCNGDNVFSVRCESD
jgi:hypothetical protein